MCNDIWTNSRLKTYQACPMKERFRYRDCLVPIGRRDALNIGTAVHRGIETWSVDEALNALEFDFPSSTEEAEAQEVMRGTVEAMLNGYFNCYAPFEDAEPELLFSMPLRFPTKRGMRSSRRQKLSGKIDAVAHIDGQDWIVEYKTAGQIDKSYFDRLYVDSQITLYMLAARRLGFKPVGVIYRVLKKPALRRRQNETVDAFVERMKADYLARPEFYFYETRLYRSEDDLSDFERQMWYEVQQADRNAAQGRVYRHSHACSNYGTCPYLPLCTGESGAEAMYEYREPNEELRQE